MVKWLRKIGNDLANGRNLELYLTIVISLVLSVLGVLGTIPNEVVVAGTLATLALLAFGTINSREQIESFQNKVQDLSSLVSQSVLGSVRAENFFLKEKPDLENEFRRAREICVVGVTLGRTVREYLGVFEERLRHGASIRVLIIDPESEAVKQAGLRSFGSMQETYYGNRIKPTIDLLQILASLPDLHGSLQVALLPYVPSFGLFLVNPNEVDGKIYVEIYPHRTLEHDPAFLLDAQQDSDWYQFFRRQFDSLWSSARMADAKDGLCVDMNTLSKPEESRSS